MFLFETRIYPLTDARLSGLSHAEQVVRLSDGGAKLIQLREKNLTPGEFFKQAEAALLIARQRGVRIVINDRVDIALALEADGVHLGQEDFPPEAARRLLGDGAIIGVSTHNVEQARRAAKLPVNYLAIGPIFATSSKQNCEPLLGLDGLRQVRDATGNFPIVAIGGISQENALEVLESGADALAVISALLAQPDEVSERTKRLLAQALNAHKKRDKQI
ncbi:MAG: thiamine phosphate synthase [Acidobacteriota bacterium]|nr:thiamine phosphate synthase [Acidobacteriota bacterium]